MLDQLPALRQWLADGQDCAAATIVAVEGSVPRPVGTTMLISAAGEVAGTLSGGCVEASVFDAALEALATGQPRRMSFGYSPQDAFEPGLSCGGTLDVHIQPFRAGSGPVTTPDDEAADVPASTITGPASAAPAVALLWRVDGPAAAPLLLPDTGRLAAAGPQALAGVVRGLPAGPAGQTAGSEHTAGATTGPGTPGPAAVLSDSAVNRIAAAVHAAVQQGHTGLIALPAGDECPAVELFIESRLPAPRLLLVGANDHSAAVAALGRSLGYHVSLCDPRPVFTRPERFPHAAVTVQWPETWLAELIDAEAPDPRTVFCLFSHDARFDAAVLDTALRQEWAYVGAMGSRRTCTQRADELQARGVPADRLARLHAPIGLDIGAATPQEIAVAVFAEVLAKRTGRTGLPLSLGSGALHGTGDAAPAHPGTAPAGTAGTAPGDAAPAVPTGQQAAGRPPGPAPRGGTAATIPEVGPWT